MIDKLHDHECVSHGCHCQLKHLSTRNGRPLTISKSKYILAMSLLASNLFDAVQENPSWLKCLVWIEYSLLSFNWVLDTKIELSVWPSRDLTRNWPDTSTAGHVVRMSVSFVHPCVMQVAAATESTGILMAIIVDADTISQVLRIHLSLNVLCCFTFSSFFARNQLNIVMSVSRDK